MKTLSKIYSTSLVVLALFATGCNNSAKKDHDHKDGHSHTTGEEEKTFACPMHPEEVGKEGDECSKCGMKLTRVENSSKGNEYFMDFQASPALEAGKPATLSFTPKVKGKESEPVPLDIQHDKKMHLIVVSKDLSYFDHIHPDYTERGAYEIKVLAKDQPYTTSAFANETRFEKGGDYVLFADYLPTGSTHQLERIAVNVSGTPSKSVSFTKAKTVSVVDGYEVSLIPDGEKFLSEGTMHISAVIKKDGKEIPASELENYLGAKAHVVMISQDTKDYLHVHPEVVNGRLDLHTAFGKTGIFRGWLQFQKEGEVHTADFVVSVEEGKAAESTHDNNEHAHHH